MGALLDELVDVDSVVEEEPPLLDESDPMNHSANKPATIHVMTEVFFFIGVPHFGQLPAFWLTS
jgi:hypothetical protein